MTPGSGYTEGDAHRVIAEVFKEVMPSTATYEYSGMSRELEEAAGSNATSLIYVICAILILRDLRYSDLPHPWITLQLMVYTVGRIVQCAFRTDGCLCICLLR